MEEDSVAAVAVFVVAVPEAADGELEAGEDSTASFDQANRVVRWAKQLGWSID